MNYLRLKRFLALLLSASLSLSPSAARGEILKQSEFPSHRWIDKTPRKFKECVVGYCIKLELDQKWVRDYFESALRPRIFLRVRYLDNKNRNVGSGSYELMPPTDYFEKIKKDKRINPKLFYFYPAANQNSEFATRPIKFSKVIIEQIITFL